jgi:hypothetical protein
MSSTASSPYPFVPESTTEVYWPKSKKKKVIDSKGNIISDTAKGEKQ